MEQANEHDRGWWAVGASATGSRHLRSGTTCQDAYGVRHLPGDGLAIASADGAGSAARSELGAKCAVDTVLAAIERAMIDNDPAATDWDASAVLQRAVEEARCAVERLAAAEEGPLRAYATTLTCALAFGGEVAVAQIGDGLVVAEDDAGVLTPIPMARPERGEYANETFFLTGSDATERLSIEKHPGQVRSLVVTTDGLVDLAMELPTYQPFDGFFRPLLGFATEASDSETAAVRLAAFLASERVRERTDDDTSLVLAVRRMSIAEPISSSDDTHDESELGPAQALPPAATP